MKNSENSWKILKNPENFPIFWKWGVDKKGRRVMGSGTSRCKDSQSSLPHQWSILRLLDFFWGLGIWVFFVRGVFFAWKCGRVGDFQHPKCIKWETIQIQKGQNFLFPCVLRKNDPNQGWYIGHDTFFIEIKKSETT